MAKKRENGITFCVMVLTACAACIHLEEPATASEAVSWAALFNF